MRSEGGPSTSAVSRRPYTYGRVSTRIETAIRADTHASCIKSLAPGFEVQPPPRRMSVQHSSRHARQLDVLLLQALNTVVYPPTFFVARAPVDESALDPIFHLSLLGISFADSHFKALAQVHDIVPDLAPSSSLLPPAHNPLVFFDQSTHVERGEGITVLWDVVDDIELLRCTEGLNVDSLFVRRVDFVVGEGLRGSFAEGLSARREW